MVYENLFTMEGRRRHEVVLVHSFFCELPAGGIRHTKNTTTFASTGGHQLT
jgi:hypothetical protein